jgi:hypothetical protein
MPVKTRGRKIVERRSGKVVGTAKSPAKARASAAIRNRAYHQKHGKKR